MTCTKPENLWLLKLLQSSSVFLEMYCSPPPIWGIYVETLQTYFSFPELKSRTIHTWWSCQCWVIFLLPLFCSEIPAVSSTVLGIIGFSLVPEIKDRELLWFENPYPSWSQEVPPPIPPPAHKPSARLCQLSSSAVTPSCSAMCKHPVT